MSMPRVLVLLAALGPIALQASAADRPEVTDERATLRAQVGDQIVDFPTVSLSVRADVAGDLATVTLTQAFANPATQPVDATYLFPLPADAAVDRMEMRSGDELVRARIEEVGKAKATYARARDEGRTAALTVQSRPGTYMQSVANLMPGEQVTVTLRYVQPVPRKDGAYELVVPLVVGPYYQPPREPEPSSVPSELQSRIEQPTRGGSAARRRVDVRIRLAAGSPLGAIESRTHQLVVTRTSPREAMVDIAPESPDRDLVVRYELAGKGVEAGAVAAAGEHGSVVSLLVEPPDGIDEHAVAPREVVFVLDCSGSMMGLPLAAAKKLVVGALDGLRPFDSFRIIRFSDLATEYSSTPLPADAEHVRAAKTLVESLDSEGGTKMTEGVHQALAVPAPEGVLRVVVFLTDGYIGNDQDVLALVHREIGEARLFPFGIGTATNRALLDEMGRIGRGSTRYVDPTDDVDAQVATLVARIDAPVLTDLSVDWGDLGIENVVPLHVPDLFAGTSVRLLARTRATSGTHVVTVSGLSAGERVSYSTRVEIASRAETAHALGSAWARARVAEELGVLAVPEEAREERVDDEELKRRVTTLGLENAIVTPWTSFVAVSERVANVDRGATPEVAVPLADAAGTTPMEALPAPVTATALFATPEPSFVTGLLVAAAALGLAWRVRRPM